MMLGVLPGLGSQGERLGAGRRWVVARSMALVVVVLLVFGGGSARAELGHPFLGSFGSFKSVSGLAVDESAGREGNVYVVNGGGPEVVEVFNAEGGTPPTGGSPQQLTAALTPQGAFAFFSPSGITVDSSESASKGDVYVNNVLYGAVDKFALNPLDEYEYVSQFEGFGLALTVDSLGDVYVAEFEGSVAEYTAEGVLVGRFSSPSIVRPDGVVVDTAGDIYVQDYEAPHRLLELTRSSPVSTEVSSESTIAEGVSGIAFDRATGDLYADFGGDVEELNSEHAVVSTLGLGLLEGSNAVAVAEKSEAIYVDSGSTVLRFGPAVAPTAPKIEEVSATAVSGTSATLQAQITPDWSPTSYHFEYGPGESYGTSIPVPAGEIHAGGSVVSVSVHVQGLSAGTVYHYRVVASNEVGGSSGADHTFTTQPVGGEFVLPDDRQFELVSPANKHGGEVLGLTSLGEGGIAQVSEEGDAATYLSRVALEANSPANAVGLQYVSRRAADGWTTQNISAPVSGIALEPPGAGSDYQAFSPDLSRGIIRPYDLGGEGENGVRHLSPEQPEHFRDILTWNQGMTGFQPLVTKATPGIKGQEGGGEAELAASFAGGSPDLKHVILSSALALTANSQNVGGARRGNLFEWADGALRLVNVLPNGKTTAEENGEGASLGSSARDTRNAVSADGSHVIWSWSSIHEHIYESNMSTGRSVQLDAPQGGSNNTQNETERAVFDAASADGSKVFFTSNAPLTSNAKTGLPCGNCVHGGNDLYVFDGATGGLTDLTPDHNPADICMHGYFPSEPCGADVQGVVGASEDGTSVYVVANGVLAEGAHLGNCKESGGNYTASCNLYLLHYDGSSWEPPRFVASLTGEDEPDWRGNNGAGLDRLTARVSPDGRYLGFVSIASLTGYDNTDTISGQPDTEVYLYDSAGTGRLACISCNPTGARPTGQFDSYAENSIMDPEQAWAQPSHWLSGMLPGWDAPNVAGEGALHQPRYLSGEGRLFFDSTEALVPQDTNGRVDVYEYEPAGVGSCRGEGGCIYLISGGTGSNDSTFVDASASGNDAFFVSVSQLVPQDVDNAIDMYDARACTDASRCFPVSPVLPPACTSADACRPAPVPQPPIFGAPASATFSGPGNPTGIASKPPVVRRGGKPKAKGRGHTRKRKRKARKAKRVRAPRTGGRR